MKSKIITSIFLLYSFTMLAQIDFQKTLDTSLETLSGIYKDELKKGDSRLLSIKDSTFINYQKYLLLLKSEYNQEKKLEGKFLLD